MKKITITKKIARHGKQAIIIVPKIFSLDLEPGTLVEIKITILRKNIQGDEEYSSDSQIKQNIRRKNGK